MIRDLTALTCRQFIEELFSKAPVPGGGGAAALIGAVGASLTAMAGNLTAGKKKFAHVEEDIQRMLAKSKALRKRLLDLVIEDAAAFEPLSKAYSLPKDSEGYQETMYKVTMGACKAPFEMMKRCCEVIDLTEEMSAKCSRLMISDVACGALAAKAALECAALNVFINTRMFRGDEKADEMEREAKEMLDVYSEKAQKTADEVMKTLKGE